ncbi:hypothetical protein CPB84DRAFT_1842802 [Gymnopilus junonius]|uniref:DUF6534 domain-containing protein n=1 Tax=Gymnopilus junonius TaxID=109634 RepID=A0A9P5TTS6_GYMJU|nr:hypothetical protein CPB84DRAFT_1842802 [Gymnopilus junonius]
MGAFDETVGVLLIGILFNTFLYGLVVYQFLVYRSTKFNDPLWIKCIVGTLFAVDTLHSAVAAYSAWETCVTNYNNPASLAVISWTIPFTAVATSFAAILTQFFLGHRVYKLTKSKPIVGVIGLFSLVGFVFGCYSGVRSGIVKYVANFTPLNPFVICWLGFQSAADLLITFVLSFVLFRSRTGFRKTDTVINRLIRGAIQTGLFASLFALADLCNFVLHKNTNLYAMFAYPIGRIYTNTLLDTLNSRIQLKLLGANDDVSDNDSKNAYKMENGSQTFAGVQTIDTKFAGDV